MKPHTKSNPTTTKNTHLFKNYLKTNLNPMPKFSVGLKKFLKILIIFLLVFNLTNICYAGANEVNVNNENTNKKSSIEEIDDTGLLPDSPIYFLKTWWEEIQLFFTFNTVKKAELQQKLATKRILEAKKLVEKGKIEVAEKHLEKFKDKIEKMVEKTEKAEEKGRDVEELVNKLEDNALRQQEVLQEVYEKVPDSAKESILNAMENSAKGLENAMEKVQKSEELKQFKEKLENKIENLGAEKKNEVKEHLKAKGILDSENE